ncbi:MAG: hypothetical protein HY907_22060 [Deltaproteobacteria bacterium]|nr:hypothetical protein [Deltaproteobacteria bacterium]
MPAGPFVPLWSTEPIDPEGMHDAAEGEGWDEAREIVSVVDVEMAPLGQYSAFDAQGLSFVAGDRVVVATPRGLEMGRVVRASRIELRRGHDLPKVLRRAAAGDERQSRRNVERAQEAMEYAERRVRELDMPMKLLGVELLHGGSRAVFHFESEERIDFRQLVHDLAEQLRLRIDMRQVGVRDAAKLVGALGRCGQPACCARYMRNFCPVSIRMAKDQNLVLSPEKVSGVCGRLLCCLSYEHEGYRSLRAGLPKVGKRIATPAGEALIKDVDVLRRRVTVELFDGDRKVFSAEELGLPGAGPAAPGVACTVCQPPQEGAPGDAESEDDACVGFDPPAGPDPDRRPQSAASVAAPAPSDPNRGLQPAASAAAQVEDAGEDSTAYEEDGAVDGEAAAIGTPGAPGGEDRQRRRRRRRRRGGGGGGMGGPGGNPPAAGSGGPGGPPPAGPAGGSGPPPSPAGPG